MSTSLHSQRARICAVTGCEANAHPGHDFCTKTHALKYMSDCLHELNAQSRLCKMPGCIRQVFVESKDNGKAARVHQFCSWKHAKLYVAHNEIAAQDHSLEFWIGALKRWALQKKETRGVEIDANFFTKHPRQILTHPECSSRHIIAKCKFKKNSDKDRDMTTKDGMHWKQQGKASAVEKIKVQDCSVSKRYLTYSELRSSRKYQAEAGIGETGKARKRRLLNLEIPGEENYTYTIVEYRIVDHPMDQDFKSWCLLKVAKTQSADQRRVKTKTKIIPEADHQVLMQQERQQNAFDQFLRDQGSQHPISDEYPGFIYQPDINHWDLPASPNNFWSNIEDIWTDLAHDCSS